MIAVTMIDGVAQISIPVRDLPKAVAFYRDVLELKFLFEVPGMAFFDCGGVRLLVGSGTPAAPQTGSMVYFRTSSMEALISRLREEGAKVLNEPQMIARLADRDVWLAHFEDPDQNVLSLMQEKLHEGTG